MLGERRKHCIELVTEKVLQICNIIGIAFIAISAKSPAAKLRIEHLAGNERVDPDRIDYARGLFKLVDRHN